MLDSLTYFLSGGCGPVTLAVAALGVEAGFLYYLIYKLRNHHRKEDGQSSNASKLDDLLEYYYDGCPIDSGVYSAGKRGKYLNGNSEQPTSSIHHHTDLELSEEELELGQKMAKLAKESYKCPAPREGYRTLNISGLPNVTIFDNDLRNKVFSGVLKVQLHCASNLRPVGLLSISPIPYVEVFVSGSSFRSKNPKAQGGQRLDLANPTWEETHYLYIRDPKYDSLSVRVLGDTILRKGCNLGTAVLGLGGLVDHAEDELTFKLPLRGFAGENSTVTVTCCFHKFPPGQRPGEQCGVNAATTRVSSCSSSSSASASASRTLDAMLQDYQEKDQGTPCAEVAHLADMGLGLGDKKLRPLAYVDCGSTETQAWVYGNSMSRQLAIAFRGTEKNRIADILTDMQFMPCGFETITRGSKTKEASRRSQARVHRGFMRAYKSVRRMMASLVYDITEPEQDGWMSTDCLIGLDAASRSSSDTQNRSPRVSDPGDSHYTGSSQRGWHVYLTGHSLGGALATLAAYELSIYKGYAGNIRSVSLHTYGSPRVGNKIFAEDFDRICPSTWRFTNRFDVVPTIPPSSVCQYHHVGHPVRLRDEKATKESPAVKVRILRGLTSLEQQVDTMKPLIRADVQHDINALAAVLHCGVSDHFMHEYEKRLGRYDEKDDDSQPHAINLTATTRPAQAQRGPAHACCGPSAASQQADPTTEEEGPLELQEVLSLNPGDAAHLWAPATLRDVEKHLGIVVESQSLERVPSLNLSPAAQRKPRAL